MTVRRTIASACAAACLGLAGVRTVAAEDLSQLDLRSLMNMDITLVNAQKRTEDAAQVPISMTVVKADAIRALNLESTSDLQFVVPGLTTTSNVGLMLPYIRGIGTDINTSGIERSVAIYVDGVYQATQTFVDLADVEQIEVLKGPQGTLYGRNASGGAINITTRGPSDKFTATTEATAGNLDIKDGYAFVSGPVNEDVRLSLAAHLRDRAGTYYNLYDGQHVDDEHYYSLHGRAQFDVTSTFRGEALVSYFSRDDSVAFGNQAELNSIPALLGYGVSTRPYVTDSDITDPANRSDATAAALKLTWEAPFAKLQSISSYANQRRAFSADLDASTAKLAHGRIHSNADVFTQELQLSPLHEQEHLDWLLGAFYIDSADAFTPVAAEVTVPAVGPLTIVTTGEAHTQATAMFGEATWWLNPSWSLTGGARYSYEYRVIDNSTVGILGGPVIQFPEHHHHWDDTTYRAIVKYSLERTMVYAKTETGFKSGVYNTTNTTQLEPVAPEKVTASILL